MGVPVLERHLRYDSSSRWPLRSITWAALHKSSPRPAFGFVKKTNTALNEMGNRFARTWQSGRSGGDTFQFESPSAMFRVLTPKRWELIEQLQKLGPSSVRGLARELERDVKRVHEDVAQLISFGLIARTGGKVHVPYDVIHADFDLRAIA